MAQGFPAHCAMVPGVTQPSAAAHQVLVLEHSASFREMLALHLSNAGYTVLQAEDAVVAGKLILQRAPDLIITDIEVPYMSGVELVGALRGDPSFKDIPVIFLSSQVDLETAARQVQAQAFLRKPVSVDRLLQTVSLCLQ